MCTKDRDKAKPKWQASCVEPATRTLRTADSETERRGLGLIHPGSGYTKTAILAQRVVFFLKTTLSTLAFVSEQPPAAVTGVLLPSPSARRLVGAWEVPKY